MASDDLMPRFGRPVGPWMKTFAWWPRFTADAGKVWLRIVWKRHIHKYDHLVGGSDFWFQYRRFPVTSTTHPQGGPDRGEARREGGDER